MRTIHDAYLFKCHIRAGGGRLKSFCLDASLGDNLLHAITEFLSMDIEASLITKGELALGTCQLNNNRGR